MDTNIVLRDLLTAPLMLSVVALTYRDKAVKDLPQLGTSEQQQQQIFKHYIERMLGRSTTPQQTRQWLTWLAQRMQQFSLAEFYLEWLQPTWLATKRAQAYYTWLFWLLWGLFFGLLAMLVGKTRKIKFRFFIGGGSWRGFWWWLFFGLLGGLLVGLFVGLFGGMLVRLFVKSRSRRSDVQITKNLSRRPNQGVSSSGRIALLSGLLVGLFFGLLVGLGFRLVVGPGFGLVGGLTTAALLCDRVKAREKECSPVFNAVSDRIGNVQRLALDEQS